MWMDAEMRQLRADDLLPRISCWIHDTKLRAGTADKLERLMHRSVADNDEVGTALSTNHVG